MGRAGLGSAAIALAAIALAVAAPAPVAAELERGEPGPPTATELERATETALAREAGAARASGGAIVAPDPDPDPGELAAVPLLAAPNFAVALYGAPQLTATALGKRSAAGAARKLRRQARAYALQTARPVVRSINLIGVIATASAGADGAYRMRQPGALVRRYLQVARSIGARLTLDIQPGRSSLIAELRALRRWIAMPDVDVGIDPEWNVGRRGVPGVTTGKVRARELNRASRWIADLVAQRELPPKAMIVHQFHEGSVRGRGDVRTRRRVQVLLNFDGIGAREPKKAQYRRLAVRRLHNGFSLFYDRDIDLIEPRAVLRLRPTVDYAMYQ